MVDELGRVIFEVNSREGDCEGVFTGFIYNSSTGPERHATGLVILGNLEVAGHVGVKIILAEEKLTRVNLALQSQRERGG
ncbi:MAG: hypothetical protein RBG13Loki_4094 [Promethearchaeota archaeon CR_4]|nr:MAG: hypothetical protein RBG13Loki_4094 [Candidatus Lokiarchaeota archaeon CR_4]